MRLPETVRIEPDHATWASLLPAGTLWQRAFRMVVAALLSSAAAYSQLDEDDEGIPPLPKEIAQVAQKYARVVQWLGFFETSTAGATTWGNPQLSIAGSRQVEARSRGRFTLRQHEHGWDPRRGEFTWVATKAEPGEMSGAEYDRFALNEGNSGQSETWQREITGTVPLLATEFSLILPKQRVHLHAGHAADDKAPEGKRIGERIFQASGDKGQRILKSQPINETFRGSIRTWMSRPGGPADRAAALQEWATAGQGPGVLCFVYEAKGAFVVGAHPPQCQHRSRVWLAPVYDDLEVVVTIDGYADWRPQGSIAKPGEPGNSLTARAMLISKTGKVPKLPAVKRFTFELLDTSREPGICLNWPLNAKDQDYDLRLAVQGAGTLSAADQMLTLPNPPMDDQQRPYGEARIDSYDFGGRATLQVICLLEDGREIMGLLKNEGGESDLVRLPKMDGPDWIAQGWRREKRVEKLSALHDEEEVKGQKHNGDGFSLYEEYRGWVEQGKHVEGDPLKKDLFVRNTIGADAMGGIALFERASKLRVHSRLRESEFSRELRLMNGNRRDAPNRVKQHGLYLEASDGWGNRGGATSGMSAKDAEYAFRPGTVWKVHVETRRRQNGLFSAASSASYNLNERDASAAYDRAVAHELLHSVGADHHGVAGIGYSRYFQGASDPNNPTRRARFVTNTPFTSDRDLTYTPEGRPMTAESLANDLMSMPAGTFLWEDTGQDIAESLAPAFERALAAERAYRAANPPAPDPGERATRFPYYKKDAHYWRESDLYEKTVFRGPQFELFVTVENPGEACSGNELCLMRYYFANAYPAEGRKDTYYVVRPGSDSNRVGREVCTSPQGTLHNAPSHKPQSRFGDAHAGRGNCFGDICPNDAIAPRKL